MKVFDLPTLPKFHSLLSPVFNQSLLVFLVPMRRLLPSALLPLPCGNNAKYQTKLTLLMALPRPVELTSHIKVPGAILAQPPPLPFPLPVTFKFSLQRHGTCSHLKTPLYLQRPLRVMLLFPLSPSPLPTPKHFFPKKLLQPLSPTPL